MARKTILSVAVTGNQTTFATTPRGAPARPNKSVRNVPSKRPKAGATAVTLFTCAILTAVRAWSSSIIVKWWIASATTAWT